MNAKTCFVPTLNGITVLEHSFIRDFLIVSSIKDQLPIGYIDYYDQDGSFLANYENLSIGTPITFNTVTDSDDDFLKKFKIKNYVILSIEVLDGKGSSGQFDRIKGNIRIWFGHKWFLYKDTKNHAYAPMKNSELVKKILKDNSRGIGFNTKTIDASDDDGSVSRYKTCESDLDFLNNKVIPFCAHKKMPMYLFCDFSDNFSFASFRSMYEQKPKVFYTPAVITENEGYDTILAAKEMDSLKCENSANFITANVSIGDKNFLDESRTKFFIESSGEGLFVSGIKNPLSTAGTNVGSKFYNLLPINRYYAMYSKGSNTFTSRNRLIQDATSLVYSRTKDLDDCFKLTISGYFDAKQFNVGETANIYFNLGNWLNGKWLIESFMISTGEGDSKKDNLLQSLVLIRPTFCGDENTSTLNKSLSYMYSVKENK